MKYGISIAISILKLEVAITIPYRQISIPEIASMKPSFKAQSFSVHNPNAVIAFKTNNIIMENPTTENG